MMKREYQAPSFIPSSSKINGTGMWHSLKVLSAFIISNIHFSDYSRCFNRKNLKNLFVFLLRIDATIETGRLGRLVNHHRRMANLRPNLFTFNGDPHIIFSAKREINVGEQLLYDYGDRSKSSIKHHPWLSMSMQRIYSLWIIVPKKII